MSDRRSFVTRLLAGTGAAIAVSSIYGVLRYLRPPYAAPASVVLDDTGLPTATDAPKIVRLGLKDAVVARTPDGSLRAMSLTCTHTGCSVHWLPASRQFHCPCHNGTFAEDGTVVSGPPRRALEILRIERVDAGVRITDEPL